MHENQIESLIAFIAASCAPPVFYHPAIEEAENELLINILGGRAENG